MTNTNQTTRNANRIKGGAASVIAMYFSDDIADVREGRYHAGRTGSLQIYVIGNDYYTACHSTRKAPPKCHDEHYNFNWECLERDFFGWSIYVFRP